MGKQIDSFRGQYRFLSNFYPSVIQYTGYWYPTVEHAYQAAKTRKLGERVIFQCPSELRPGDAKREGKKVTLRANWNVLKIIVMKNLLREKFKEPVLRKQLLGTGDSELIEGNDWGDEYWGKCRGRGLNWLGKLLMEVRDEIHEQAD